MRKVLSILLLSCCVAAHAHDPISLFANVDSLKKAGTFGQEDTGKVILYANLSYAYLYKNNDTTVHHAAKGLALAKRLHLKIGEMLPLEMLQEALVFKGIKKAKEVSLS